MGGKGSGPRKKLKRTLSEAIDAIDCEGIFVQLNEWAQGKAVMCPHCMRDTGAKTADSVSLQSAIELLNRRLGKPKQEMSIDVTQQLVLTADQIDRVLERYQIAQQAIEGEYKLIGGSCTETQTRQEQQQENASGDNGRKA